MKEGKIRRYLYQLILVGKYIYVNILQYVSVFTNVLYTN